MTTSLPLSLIVNVQLNLQPNAPIRRNFGAIVLLTPEVGPFNEQGSIFLLYSTLQAIGQAFGTDSETYRAATPFFAQTPRPRTIITARWDAEGSTVPAAAAALFGRPVTVSVPELAVISEGTITIPINGIPVTYGDIDLTTATTFAQVATILDAAMTTDGIGCRFDSAGTRFIVESRTPGTSIQLGFATGSGSGYLGTILGLDNVAPTYTIPGTEQQTIPAATIPQALSLLSQVYQDWYAAVVVKSPLTDAEILSTANYIMGADRKLFGLTLLDASQISQASGNPIRQLYDQQAYRVAAQYDHTNPYAIVSFLARGLSVNFAGSNTTLTMKFKQQPTVAPIPLTETEAAACKSLGVNYYAYYDTVPMVAEGTVIGGRFFDEVHILDWYCDAVQKNVFAVLYQSPTKVPLTDPGTHRLLRAIESASREGVRNGAFAPGIWNGDPFGSLETGDMLDQGFYIYADSVDTLSVSDRQERKAPPIQVALKLAGAIHSADVIVNFDR
jgi:hypothetical protein